MARTATRPTPQPGAPAPGEDTWPLVRTLRDDLGFIRAEICRRVTLRTGFRVARFLGFDHIDTRVRDLALVEAFYDALMPQLGLTRKTIAFVDAAGDWQDPTAQHPYNTIEFHEEHGPAERPHHFIGFIEDRSLQPNGTRIAFAVESRDALLAWEPRLRELGAREIEFSEDMDTYPALFFEDPGGTKLELCARNRRPD